MTIAQAIVTLIGVTILAVCTVWAILPGAVTIDASLTEAQATQLRDDLRLADQTHVSLGTGYDADTFLGERYECPPGDEGSFDSSGARRLVASSPQRFEYLQERLAQEKARCAVARDEHQRLASRVAALAMLALLLAIVALRGRGPRLRPVDPRAPSNSVFASVTAAPVDATSGEDGGRAFGMLCDRCGQPLDTRSESGWLVGRPSKCEPCLAHTLRPPLFLLWSLSAVVLAVGVSLAVAGYETFALATTVLGALMPVLAVHITLHESAHALVGLALGAPSAFVTLGSGPMVATGRLGRLRVRVRMAPSRGLTVAPIRSTRWYRLRTWLLVAAGPALTAAIVALAWFAAPAGPIGSAVRWLLVGIGAVLLVQNLLPIEKPRGFAGASTDGYRLATLPFLSRQAAAMRAGVVDELEVVRNFAAFASDPSGVDATTRAMIDEGMARGRPASTMLSAAIAITERRWADAAVACRAARNLPGLPPAAIAGYQNSLAWALLMTGDVVPGGEADQASAAAMAADPEHAAYRSTRAEVLAVLGRFAEAREMARGLVDEAWTPDGRPRWVGDPPEHASERHLVLAAVELAAGDLDAAEALAALADRHGADPDLVARVHRGIAAARGAGSAPAIDGGTIA